MSNFFKNFPLVRYSFGDAEASVLFQDMSVYIDLLDTLSDDANFYHKYEILSGDRPDIVSNKLYGSIDYYWMFFLLNDHIRECGWPLSDAIAYDHVKLNYPNWTIVTEDNIAATEFVVGGSIEGNSSGASGTIIERNLDLGQIIVNSDAAFSPGEVIRAGLDLANQDFARVYSTQRQYDSVHHYEDPDGEWTDIDPFDQASSSGLTPITHVDRFVLKNDSLKSINVLRPSVIEQVSNEFQKLLKS